jgi:hypothetical protein
MNTTFTTFTTQRTRLAAGLAAVCMTALLGVGQLGLALHYAGQADAAFAKAPEGQLASKAAAQASAKPAPKTEQPG